MICDGELVGVGSPADILTAENLRDVFGVDATIEHGPNGQCAVRYHAGMKKDRAA
jgi:iron complex transport system ATP-binding protein